MELRPVDQTAFKKHQIDWALKQALSHHTNDEQGIYKKGDISYEESQHILAIAGKNPSQVIKDEIAAQLDKVLAGAGEIDLPAYQNFVKYLSGGDYSATAVRSHRALAGAAFAAAPAEANPAAALTEAWKR